MKCDDFEVMLAEALGGELSDADRPLFERHLAGCAVCRSDYESGLATVARLRGLPAADAERALVDAARMAEEAAGSPGSFAHQVALTPDPSPKGRGGVGPRPIPMPRKRWGFAGLRYAASVVIAFSAGYAVNGLGGTKGAGEGSMQPAMFESPAKEQLASATFGAAYAETYQRQPSRSELSRCLTAVFGKQN
jgi:anti-sigma factor RsiW